MNYSMEKMKIRHLYIAGLLCVLCGFMASCSDDDLYSMDQKVYVNSGINGILSLHLIDTPIGIVTEQKTLGFPVVSSRELAADAEITFKVNESLVESYNTLNEKEYKVLPASCYTIKNLVVKMKQGEFTSQDSVKVEISKLDDVELGETYLLPITMSSVVTDDKGLQVSANLNTIYLKIDKEYRIYSSDAISEDKLMDNTGWSITSSSRVYDGNVANTMDGKPNTVWFVSSSTSIADLDMKAEQTINGVSFCPYYGVYSTSTYSAKGVTISTSTDGVNYEELLSASLKTDGSLSAPAYNYLGLYSSVKTRYLRFTFTNTTSYVGINLINLYK